MVGEPRFLLLDELCKDTGPPMVESLWQQMPEALVERILLFVPASSQARHRSVCKRWSQLVTSSAFRDETDRIAFRRGCRNFLTFKLEVEAENGTQALHKVDIPGMTLPTTKGRFRVQIFTGAGLVGVAQLPDDQHSLRCWLLNIANKTWRELPELKHVDPQNWTLLRGWFLPSSISLVPAESSLGFQVIVCRTTLPVTRAFVHTFSSTSNHWETAVLASPRPRAEGWTSYVPTKGGFLRSSTNFKTARIGCWESGAVTQLPEPPCPFAKIVSNPDCVTVFAAGRIIRPDPAGCPRFTVLLYRLDESSSSRLTWTCLYSGPPPPSSRQLARFETWLTEARILGNMLLLVTRRPEIGCSVVLRDCLAYHMLEGSCNWFRIPAVEALEWQCENLFLEPTLISQLRL